MYGSYIFLVALGKKCKKNCLPSLFYLRAMESIAKYKRYFRERKNCSPCSWITVGRATRWFERSFGKVMGTVAWATITVCNLNVGIGMAEHSKA